MKRRKYRFGLLGCALSLLGVSCAFGDQGAVGHWSVGNEACAVEIAPEGFRFQLVDASGAVIAPAHAESGLKLNGQRVVDVQAGSAKNRFIVTSSGGLVAEVEIVLENGVVLLTVDPLREGWHSIELSLGGMPVAYGLGDAGGWSGQLNLVRDPAARYRLKNDGGAQRWQSSFVIFPRNELAGVVFDGKDASVVLGPDEYTMQVKAKQAVTFHYFTGAMPAIYRNYKALLVGKGYPWVKPKSRLFELGWESWAALGYLTRDETVIQSVSEFQNRGYPIRWAVVGSGFWDEGGTTTSFGKYGKKFPDPAAFKARLHALDVKWMIGLRTNFVLPGGPHIPKSAERDRNLKGDFFKGNPLSKVGVEKDYFVKTEAGDLLVQTSRWFPIVPCYLLDGENPEAVDWYSGLYNGWGVDGLKEDTMMHLGSEHRDIFNAPVARLADEGALVMARCGSFSSPGTLLRINDTQVSDMSLRTPINYWHYAACGAPNIYSDTVGFRKMGRYTDQLVRHGWLMALTAGLAVGEVPRGWTEKQEALFKRPFDFHYKIGSYLYDAAMKSYQTGYPYTLTPLGIAYPKDANAAEPSHYQWMAGESLLCAPLVKDHESGKMDLYLPEGIWFDYDTGKKYEGPIHLKDFSMPRDKTPCFVGGRGVLVTRESDEAPLIARIYPTEQAGKDFTFNHPDGSSQSVLTFEYGDGRPVVENTTLGETVPVILDEASGAHSFVLLPGNNYAVKVGR